MKLELKKSRIGNGRIARVYDLGSYEVSTITFNSGAVLITITPDRTKPYLPEIYEKEDPIDGHITCFKIQTTSYGALLPEEIRKVIDGLEEAMEAAEILTREFVKEVKNV